MSETWAGGCSKHGPEHTDAQCPDQFIAESQILSPEEGYRIIEALLSKLDSRFYRGDTDQQEVEVANLADAVIDVLKFSPYLDLALSDKKTSKMWEASAKFLYQTVQKTDSPEVFEKISDALALIFKITNHQTNLGPMDTILSKRVFDTWPWSDLPNTPKRTRETNRNELILKKIVANFGLDAETMFGAWYASKPKNTTSVDGAFDHPVNVAEKNLLEMRRLGFVRPDGPKTLVTEFGVHCFARYPQGLLDDQLAQIDDSSTAYGLLVQAASDHNGYHYKKESFSTLRSLWQQCRDQGINLRALEVNGQRDMRKKFFALEKKYNDPGNQKAAFGVVCGHADQEGIALGKHNSVGGSVEIQDIQTGNFIADSKRFFADGANIVLDACLVGESNGFAQKASASVSGVEIVASPKKISSTYYSLTRIGGAVVPKLEAHYRTRKLWPKKPMSRFRDGKAVI